MTARVEIHEIKRKDFRESMRRTILERVINALNTNETRTLTTQIRAGFTLVKVKVGLYQGPIEKEVEGETVITSRTNLSCSVLEVDGTPVEEEDQKQNHVCVVISDEKPTPEEQFAILVSALRKFGIEEPPAPITDAFIIEHKRLTAMRKRLNRKGGAR